MSIESRVIKCIAEISGLDAATINAESKLESGLGCDSLDMLEVIMALEDEFGFDFDDDEACKFKTVQDIINYVQKVNSEVVA